MPDSAPQSRLLPTPLHTAVIGSRVVVYGEVDSTNTRALQIGGDGLVVVADSQTAGRGRHGRTWHSCAGLGLWFSAAFEKPTPGLAFAAPLAVRDAVSAYAAPSLKWPNDVLVGGRKLAGILIESRGDVTAVGIGVNVHHTAGDFPEDLRDSAVSLDMVAGTSVSRGDLLREILTSLDGYVARLRKGGAEEIRREWCDACDIIGRRVRMDNVEGVVLALDQGGALIVEAGKGFRRIAYGDVIHLEPDASLS